MINLFIDTSISNVSIAIVKDNQIISLIQKDLGLGHSKYVTQYVKQVIDESSIDANDIDNIFVVNGPGSFTGVRIGVTIAKTYGYLIKKDIIPVSSLKILAISSHKQDGVISVIKANKNNYYVGIYDNEYNELIAEKFVSVEELLELISKYQMNVVSNDFYVLGKYKFNKVNLDIVSIIDYYKNNDAVSYHRVVPNYLKLPQVLENR